MWGNFPHQLLNHLKYTRYQNEIQPIITNPFWNKIDDKTWFPRGHSYHGYHTAPWQLIVCALFYSGIYFVFIHYWQRYESTLEPIGMHFLSEHVHNAAVWLLLLYGPFPLNVLHAVFFFLLPQLFSYQVVVFRCGPNTLSHRELPQAKCPLVDKLCIVNTHNMVEKCSARVFFNFSTFIYQLL